MRGPHERRHPARTATIVSGLLAVGAIVGSWIAFAAVVGTVSFDAERYRLDDGPVLTVSDSDLNTNPATKQTVPVSLESTADAAGISITLEESGNDTGVFNVPLGPAPTFTDSGSSDDLNNILRVDEGDTLTLTYEDSSPIGTITASATMYVDAATADLDQDTYVLDDTATITVTDVDGNLDSSTPDSVAIGLVSDTDPGGISVDLTETGDATGTFTGTATFTAGLSDDGADELQAAQGDTITLTYNEPNFAGTGTVGRNDTAAMVVTGTASLDAAHYDVTETATLSVDDADLNTDALSVQTVDVSFTSDTDGTGISGELTETGINTGVFEGSATFTTGASDDGSDVLQVAEADTITLTYSDAAPAADRTATALMLTDDATSALDQQRYRLNETATLTVTDADENTDASSAETISVTFFSDTDGTGISVDLTETGVDTGVFEGTATFNTVGSIDLSDILQVSAGDSVTLRYAEPVFAGGTTDRDATAVMFADTATVALDATDYALDDTATITVTDVDGHLDAASVETVDITLTSSTDGTGITVTLTETSASADTFTGTATFSDTASDDPTDVLHIA
ncbi:MAG: hypothetical protein R3246_12445, partial [Acidimicrobiia bacterium]|nr:hypothetical protein [Acidimicrobiia bacterium]